MSQFSHPTHTIRSQVQAHKAAWLAALLTLIAVGAVFLILSLDGDSSSSSTTYQSQPAVRTDGGPDESGVAASVGSRPSTGSSESAVAAAVGSRTARVTGGPDESSVAASISKSSQPQQSGPDEAATASAISGR